MPMDDYERPYDHENSWLIQRWAIVYALVQLCLICEGMAILFYFCLGPRCMERTCTLAPVISNMYGARVALVALADVLTSLD